MTNQPEPTVQATRYTVNCLPENGIDSHVFEITVEYRGRGLWAVKRHSQCLAADGTWDWEMRPSEREDDWLAEHRFDLDTALKLAKEARAQGHRERLHRHRCPPHGPAARGDRPWLTSRPRRSPAGFTAGSSPVPGRPQPWRPHDRH